MQARLTRGFRSPLQRSDHFTSHGKRLGAATEGEYEKLADQFLGMPMPGTARQFTRPWNGDLVRYDLGSEMFGILDRDGFIKTCYRPDPSIHGEATNLDYYLAEKGKI
jgi:pyocin large subunit-like protein